MSVRHFFAICLILLLGVTAWWILGMASQVRTYSMGERLGSAVTTLWGTPVVQHAPRFSVQVPGARQQRELLASRNHITVELQLEQRRKGLLWYPTYEVLFDAEYAINNDTLVEQRVRAQLPLPSADATYDEFEVWVDDQPSAHGVDVKQGIAELIALNPGQTRTFKVRYRTRGLYRWSYQLGGETGRVRQLDMTVATNFEAVDFPDGSLSPMVVEPLGVSSDGLQLHWQADDLITRQPVAIALPEKLNPGPLTARMSFFGPVCLVFFFVLVGAIAILKQVPIHPMHYLFVTAGFFAFNLLFVYLVDWLDVHLAFALAAGVSVGLVVSYLRASLGVAFPWKVAALGQLFYLVLFSYSFFLQGMTGLTVTVGAILTLAMLMRLTAKLDWSVVFQRQA
ncbi:MAG: cell envelope integrity protein CreD [Candidatus Competibacteraceae bacterium]|nr:cell envelope integrity protein CreD [Candidatus Competibacteraceae bacterium]